MNATGHIELDDLALYAMQLLTTEETAEIEQHLKSCPECSQELTAVRSDLALYAHTVEVQSPPATARERLMNQVAREKKVVPITRAAPVVSLAAPLVAEAVTSDPGKFGTGRFETDRSEIGRSETSRSETDKSYLIDDDDLPENRRGFVSKTLPWVGWAIAAGLAVTATNFYNERNSLQSTVATNTGQLSRLNADAATSRQILDTLSDPMAMRVTLQRPKSAPVPQARLSYVAEKGSLVFIASNMEPLELHKIYELWLIPADGTQSPVPAGTFHPDAKGNASVILPPLPKGLEAKAFGITIEDGQGGTVPTMPIIMVGT